MEGGERGSTRTRHREGGHRVTESFLGNMTGTQKPESVSTKQERIAKLAREHPDRAFSSLNHYVDYEWVE